MITLTFEPTCSEQAAVLAKFLPEYMRAGALRVEGEPAQVKAVLEHAHGVAEEKLLANLAAEAPKKSKAVKPAATPAASEVAPPPVEVAAPAPAAASPSEVTLEQVRARLAELSRDGKAPQVKEVIAGFGATKLTEIPNEKFSELLAQVEAL